MIGLLDEPGDKLARGFVADAEMVLQRRCQRTERGAVGRIEGKDAGQCEDGTAVRVVARPGGRDPTVRVPGALRPLRTRTHAIGLPGSPPGQSSRPFRGEQEVGRGDILGTMHP